MAENTQRQLEVQAAQNNPNILSKLSGAPTQASQMQAPPSSPIPTLANVQDTAQNLSSNLYGSGFVSGGEGQAEAMRRELFNYDKALEGQLSAPQQAQPGDWLGYVPDPGQAVSSLANMSGQTAGNISSSVGAVDTTERAYQSAINGVVGRLMDYLQLQENRKAREEDRAWEREKFEREIALEKEKMARSGSENTDINAILKALNPDMTGQSQAGAPPMTPAKAGVKLPDYPGWVSNATGGWEKEITEPGIDIGKINTEQRKWQAIYQATPDLKKKNAIATAFKTANGYELFGEPVLTKEQKDKQAAQKAMDGVKTQAKAIQQIVQNKNVYSNPKLYEDALNSAASDLVIKMKEAAGFGASLTGNELAILSGQAPVIQQIGRSIGNTVTQALTGQQPVQKGRVIDDEQTLLNKMNYIISGYAPQQANVSQSTQEPNQSFLQTLGSNAITDTGNILSSLTQVPSMLVNEGVQRGQEALQTGDTSQLQPGAIMGDVVGGLAGGLVNEYNELFGKPLEGGDILGRAIQRAIEKPVTTALEVLPFTGALKGLNKAKTGMKLPKVSVSKNTQSSLLRSIAKPDVKDLVRSEDIMADVVNITKSKTPQGLARELKTQFIPKSGTFLRNKMVEADNAMGNSLIGLNAQLDEIVKAIENKPGVTPETIAKLRPLLEEKLKVADISKETGGLEFWGTNHQALNQVRMELNDLVSPGWWKNRPLDSAANLKNATYYLASQAIKDVLASSPVTEDITKAILRLQSSALEAYPALSTTANKANTLPYSIMAWPGYGAKALFKPFFNFVKIMGSRMTSANPETSNLIKQIGATTTEPIQPIKTLANPSTPSRLPLDNKIIENIAKKKGPAQGERFIKELGGSKTRKGQEAQIRQSAKKRYK